MSICCDLLFRGIAHILNWNYTYRNVFRQYNTNAKANMQDASFERNAEQQSKESLVGGARFRGGIGPWLPEGLSWICSRKMAAVGDW